MYTKDGHKRIEDIKVGDQVYSVNVDTGEKGLKTVKQLFVNETYEIIHIYVGYSQIKSTAPHPFWVEGKGWVEAGNLLEGDKVKLYSGEVLEIKEIRRERLEEPVKTYNFEVEDWHTYLVSESKVLVHNAGNKKCPIPTGNYKSNTGVSNVAEIAGPNGKSITREYDELVYGGRYSKKAETRLKHKVTLPENEVVTENGVRIDHKYRSNDHGDPVHLHVEGGGPVSHIGPRGKPLKGYSLTPRQKKVIENNMDKITKTIKQIKRWIKRT
ncbi:polymorphic toxin-type HINT domain-containing protein [Acetivibrio clariflavus]|uniref:polymorphic toxin-type HINT domain-containing protein n=1 Tax=Acetivibrio clariflavus TaxID=288965 RepID=UPI001FE16A46|nr:polymorphic toxin-type HINT domain-containing protein [Acetivibrio clariflavus]